SYAIGPRWGMPAGLVSEARQRLSSSSQPHPVGCATSLFHFGLRDAIVQVREGDQPLLLCQSGEDRLECQVTVRDMERYDAIRSETRQVQLDCLSLQQVDGDGVGAKRVEDDEIVSAWALTLQSHSSVAEHDVQATAAVLQVREVASIARDTLDEWIDFIERPGVTGFRIAGQRTAAESHHGDAFETAPTRGEQLADRVGRVVVGRRLTAGVRWHLLAPVRRASVPQNMMAVVGCVDHSVSAEEAAGR